MGVIPPENVMPGDTRTICCPYVFSQPQQQYVHSLVSGQWSVVTRPSAVLRVTCRV